ncbi:MAG: hypothetical protein LKK29_01625, partial [Olsenella sp.]|nr:hypothetical protein [Olsenella sp.]
MPLGEARAGPSRGVADNPLNAPCSHGVGGAAVMERMAMVLDAASGTPLWYELICDSASLGFT